DEAEEVVQRTFTGIRDKKEQLQVQVSVKSYLYSAVRNASLTVIKHEKVKARHAATIEETDFHSDDLASAGLMSDELNQNINRAIDKLPEQCRIVFKLSRFEELKYAEIADQLGISVKTVENQIGKALRILRVELKEYLTILILLAII